MCSGTTGEGKGEARDKCSAEQQMERKRRGEIAVNGRNLGFPASRSYETTTGPSRFRASFFYWMAKGKAIVP